MSVLDGASGAWELSMELRRSSRRFLVLSRWESRESSSHSIVCFRKISCSVYAQERFDLLSPCRTAKDLLRPDDLWKARARKKAIVAVARQLAVDLWRIRTGRLSAKQLGLSI